MALKTGLLKGHLRVSSGFFGAIHKFLRVFKTIQDLLKGLKFETSITLKGGQQGNDIQYETSFLISKGQIHIFVHVPSFDKALLLDLLRFNNAPVHISGTLSVQLTPPEDILAIGKDGSHMTITTSALNELTQYGQFFFSDTAMPLHRQLNATCLGAIFSQNDDNIRSTCPAKFMQAPELFVNISPGE